MYYRKKGRSIWCAQFAALYVKTRKNIQIYVHRLFLEGCLNSWHDVLPQRETDLGWKLSYICL